MAKKVWIGGTVSNEGNYGTAANWSPSGVPTTGDDVHIGLAGSANPITTGLDQHTVALGAVFIETGSPAIGSSAGYLQLKCTGITVNATGLAYIDLGAETIIASVGSTADLANGAIGLYLKGSALTAVTVDEGVVGIAAITGETSSVTTVRATGKKAALVLGEGAAVTNIYQRAGSTISYASATATLVEVSGGTFESEGAGQITTLHVLGGKAFPNSAGTIATLKLDGGTTDFTGSGVPRTVSALQHNAGAKLVIDPAVITVTGYTPATSPVTYSAIAA